MKYKVTHTTKYIYQTPASLCHNIACQSPRTFPFQNVTSFNYTINPEPHFLVERNDFFDNDLICFSIQKPHNELLVKTVSEVVISQPDWINLDPSQSLPWETVRENLQSTNTPNDIRQFYLESAHVTFVPGITEYALESFTPGRPILEAMQELNNRIHKDFTFMPGFTEISTPMEDVFKYKKGVCQDFAHFGLCCLRSIGLSARYMSGYIETIPAPGKEKLVGADASHAWLALYVPQTGWVEFDSTNNLIVTDQHIRVAIGRDFGDVAPLKGIVYSGGGQEMVVKVDVNRLS